MSRVTAPACKLARALSSAPNAAPRPASTLLDGSAHSAGASLMPKYAELLHNRRSHEHSNTPRGLTTAHRPTPQPSLANRPRPLMQTFHSAPPAPSPTPSASAHIDATVLPSTASLSRAADDPWQGPRVPLLPDNYTAAHGPIVSAEADPLPAVTIVAADPENVVPGAPKAGVEGLGLDGVELKFMHDERNTHAAGDGQGRSSMIRDIWKGMAEDLFGGRGTAGKAV